MKLIDSGKRHVPVTILRNIELNEDLRQNVEAEVFDRKF